MTKIWVDYYKVLDTIDSCVTIEQLKGASRMLIFWLDLHLDNEIYRTTFRTHVERKFKQLNGEEIDTIPYKEILIY